MSLDGRFKPVLSDVKIDPHLMCDWLEMRLILDEYQEISRNDFDDILRDAGVYDKSSISRSPWVSRNLKENDSVISIENRYINYCWELLEKRQSWFVDFYPFIIQDGIISLKADYIRDDKYVSYVFLLICSKLRHFHSKSDRTALAGHFEDFCTQVVALMLSDAEIQTFGAAARGDTSLFSGSFVEALGALGAWWNERLKPFALNEVSTSGDYGLDIVGLVQRDRFSSGSLMFVGQCAAYENDWRKKKYETQQIRDLFDFTNTPIEALFVPVCFRQADGRWFKQSDAEGIALFDRLRLLDIMRAKLENGEVLEVEHFRQLLGELSIFDELSPQDAAA